MAREHTGSIAGERFPRQRRLRKRSEFLGVQQRGQKIHFNDVLVLHVGRSGCSRLGITVSRKVGKAVERNRIKRIIREVWRRSQRLLPEGHDVVVVAKRSAVNTTYARLLGQVGQLASRLKHGAAH